MLPDNYSVWDAHDREQERAEFPSILCAVCGEEIQDDLILDLPGYGCVCDRCIRKYKKGRE